MKKKLLLIPVFTFVLFSISCDDRKTSNELSGDNENMIEKAYKDYINNKLIIIEINNSIAENKKKITNKIKASYTRIYEKAAEQPEKYKLLAEQAHKLEDISNKTFDNIDRLVLLIIKTSQGEDSTLESEIKNKDTLSDASKVMVEENGPMMGDSLREWIEDYRILLLTFVQDSTLTVYKNIACNLEIVDNLSYDHKNEEVLTWQESLCKGMPLIGTIALLQKLQSDVRNSESDVLEYMLTKLEITEN